ncbi:MAG: hypothetical protein OWV35_00995 [Firmicutes bacterium]|nr:hypothetical protein [Bacillota bacterium]
MVGAVAAPAVVPPEAAEEPVAAGGADVPAAVVVPATWAKALAGVKANIGALLSAGSPAWVSQPGQFPDAAQAVAGSRAPRALAASAGPQRCGRW